MKAAIAAMLSGSLLACSHGQVTEQAPPAAGPGELRPFDLVARGVDDNGFALNPQLGYAFDEQCDRGRESSNDPAACSWWFGASEARQARVPPCNTLPVDPVLANNFGTQLGLTCSDSPLHYPGHVNWGRAFGEAMTFEGTLTWASFSGEGPLGDFDYNFTLQLEEEPQPARGPVAPPPDDSLHVEIDSRETLRFGSQWWASLRQVVEYCPRRAARFVGKPEAIVTAVLGIDAEHMTRNDLMLEAHPVYALAVRTCVPDGTGPARRPSGNLCDVPGEQVDVPTCSQAKERWFILARDRGTEGYCSPRKSFWGFFSPSRRPLSLPLPARRLALRLPWRCGDELHLDPETQFFHRGGPSTVAVQHHGDDPELLVTVGFPEGGEVDGELVLQPANRTTPCARAVASAKRREEAAERRVVRPYQVDKSHELHEDPQKREARLRRLRARYPEEMKALARLAGTPLDQTSHFPTWIDEPVPPRRLRKTDCELIRVPADLLAKAVEPRRGARAMPVPEAAVPPAPREIARPAEPERPPAGDEFCAGPRDEARARFCDALKSGK